VVASRHGRSSGRARRGRAAAAGSMLQAAWRWCSRHPSPRATWSRSCSNWSELERPDERPHPRRWN